MVTNLEGKRFSSENDCGAWARESPEDWPGVEIPRLKSFAQNISQADLNVSLLTAYHAASLDSAPLDLNCCQPCRLVEISAITASSAPARLALADDAMLKQVCLHEGGESSDLWTDARLHLAFDKHRRESTLLRPMEIE